MPYSEQIYYQAYHADDLERTPLVLIHGAGGDHLSWPSELRRMAGCRVFAPDLPGHGKSKGPGLQRISGYAGEILSWLYKLELPKLFLGGHSMGGAIALWIAIHQPEMLHGLVLISTGSQLPVNLSLIDELAAPQGFPAAVDSICRWSFSPGADERIVDGVRKQMLNTRPSVLGADFRACDAFNLKEELGNVIPPTLVLVGDQDKMTPLRFSEELRDGIKTAQLAVIQGAGHMLPLEKPGDVAEQLERFMAGVRDDQSIA
jgi:pimeloyl-ACP methyl ester carboxylesterase